MNRNSLPVIVFLLSTGLIVAVLIVLLRPENEDSLPSSRSSRDGPRSLISSADHDEAARALILPESNGEKTATVEDEDLPEFPALEAPGWKIWGKVVEPSGEPIANARVMLYFKFDPAFSREEPLDTVFTDDRGRYATKLEAVDEVLKLPEIHDLCMQIDGRAAAAGFISAYSDGYIYLSHPARSERPLRLDFILEPGDCVVGFVRDPAGAPVGNAGVVIQGLGDAADTEDLSAWNGFFSIPINMDRLVQCRIGAGKTGIGSSLLSEIEVAPGRVPAPLELILREFGSIEGVAVCPDGRPLPDLEIEAYPARLTEDPYAETDWDQYDVEKPLHDYLSGGAGVDWTGLSFGTAITGYDGRFRISGLRPGAYWVGNPFYDYLLEEGAKDASQILCRTGDQGIRLVFPLHRLKIVLRDEAGDLVPWAKVDWSSDRSGISGPSAYGGTVTVDIRPGPVKIRACARGGLVGEKETFIPGSTFEHEVEIVLHPAKRTGSLRFALLDELGKPLRDLDEVTLLLWGRSYGKFLKMRTDLERDQCGRYLVSVCPDRYELLVKAGGPEDMYLPFRMKDIRIRHEEEMSLDLVLRRGGRMRLAIHPPMQEKRSPVDAITLHRLDGQGATKDWGSLMLDEELILHGRCRRRIGYHLKDDILEPGEYEVRVHLRGFAPARQTFTIQAGEVSPVEVRLVPR